MRTTIQDGRSGSRVRAGHLSTGGTPRGAGCPTARRGHLPDLIRQGRELLERFDDDLEYGADVVADVVEWAQAIMTAAEQLTPAAVFPLPPFAEFPCGAESKSGDRCTAPVRVEYREHGDRIRIEAYETTCNHHVAPSRLQEAAREHAKGETA